MEKEQSQQSWPLGSHTAPWMVFTCANHTEKSQAVFSISERRLYSTSVDEMKNKFLRTPQGWFLLLGNLSSGTSLWNPITSEKVELPPMEHDPTMIRCICVTSEAPTSPNCVVVFADLKNSLLCFCHPGDEKWVSQKYDLDEDEECLESIAAVEGELYLIVRTKPEVFRFSSSLSDKLVLIEFSSYPRFTALPLEEPLIWRSGLRRRKCYLVESCGELFLLTLYSPFDAAPGIRAMLDVYKMDFAKRAWAKAYNLGDRVFFMDVFSFAASRSPSELGVKKNCIYFLFTEQSYFYIYDAEKRSLSSHETCPELRAACSTPFWCLPDSS